jgi:SPOR domain
MIRHIAAVLLAANLAFWGWAHWFREERAALPEASLTSGVSPAPKNPAVPAVQPDASRASAADDELLQDCIRLTGFASQTLLDAAASRLSGGNIKVTTGTSGDATAQDGGQAEGHWVHVAGLRDSNAQRELIDRLRSAGLSDAYAMPDDAEHRVSVGLFSDATRARQRVEQLRTLGIESSVLTRTRGNPAERWLELRGALPADITAQVIQGWGLDPALVSLSPCQQ